MPTDLSWRALTAADLPAVASLAARCLAADGGQPLIALESFLGERFAVADGAARCAVDRAGRLVGAAGLRPQPVAGQRRAVYLGLVDPAHRGCGIGSALLDWGLAEAPTVADGVVGETGSDGNAVLVVETETLTDAAAALFAGRGLHRTFAEDVMRFDLADTALPDVAVPAGIRLAPWSTALASRFFAVYAAAFAERPGFPGWSAEYWIDWTTDDEDFRPGWSLLATEHTRDSATEHAGADGASDDRVGAVTRDVAFVTCAQGWIVQLGVRPEQRGRGLGAALVTEALRRMRADGVREVLLDVNVDNPAGRLYRRLGFTVVGRRARFERVL
ncbi:GNAT family N-acetyltransferase [Micromonospora echinofusca]|uniref:GNAT family N-acetyltransferase n=1 Tax=Micromonospora echinofusca TaxID=47858 RepID=A0ABS3VY10_MICEH|nr:GNAT family N-acetyltransferase [Micromonospora echinofusca]MBO4209427.1 GNAT family N-acetyltransferase [Micromonospora echinofusca]